jgi:hypothetical protein
VIRRYRADAYRQTAARRAAREPRGQTTQDLLFASALDAAAYLAVKKLRGELRAEEWEYLGGQLAELAVYIESGSERARLEVLNSLLDVADTTRHGMPRRIASQIARLVYECFELYGGVAQEGALLSEVDRTAFGVALEIAHAFVHDGDKYLGDLSIVSDGAEILWRITRHAQLQSLLELSGMVEEAYGWILQHRSDDARRLLELYRTHPVERKISDIAWPDDLFDRLSERQSD